MFINSVLFMIFNSLLLQKRRNKNIQVNLLKDKVNFQIICQAIIILNGQIDTYISGDFYNANGVFRTEDNILGTLEGNLNINDWILSGTPIIKYFTSNIDRDEYKSQLSAITVSIDYMKLFNEMYVVDNINPWRLNSDDSTVNIAYEALLPNTARYRKSINDLLKRRKRTVFYRCFTF